MILFTKRSEAAKPPIAVTITGSGSRLICYATINGTTYTSATDGIEVMPGDMIVFTVGGASSSSKGYVKIDGKEVLTVTDGSRSTYNWNVPDGITSISIDMKSTPVFITTTAYGRITVTTA